MAPHVAQAQHRHQVAALGGEPATGPNREGIDPQQHDADRDGREHGHRGQERVEAHLLVGNGQAPLAQEQGARHGQEDGRALQHQPAW